MTAQDLDRLHETALRILSDVGISLDHAEMLDRLSRCGCREGSGRTLIPPAVVEGVLRRIPPAFDLYDRRGQEGITIGGSQTYGMNAGVFPRILDLDTGQPRPSRLSDVMETTRLLDALANVHAVFVSFVDATDAPPAAATAACFAATLANTTKPLVGPGVSGRAEAEAAILMACAARGVAAADLRRRPRCAPFVCPISPLRFPGDIVAAIAAVAEAGLPLHVATNPVLGLTAPATLAGGLALGHAEALAAAVIAHAVRPGLPVSVQNTPSVADPATLDSTSGGPEVALMRQARPPCSAAGLASPSTPTPRPAPPASTSRPPARCPAVFSLLDTYPAEVRDDGLGLRFERGR
jgi:trimethylamine--corrinoid protein Co-methyltransferase